MRDAVPRIAAFVLVSGFLITLLASTTPAQSQALNGQIEGSVLDQNDGAVPSAMVTVRNIETGTIRTSLTDSNGVYRFPLIPLGTYSISVEAANFKKLVREGIMLATGQTATVDLHLEPGEILETVSVSRDAPMADAGKTNMGRVMNNREVHNIPLPTRNPYNFVILQAGVTGRPNRGFMYPQVNVNGFLRRTYYLLDGNTNTRGDIAGARTMFISEVYVNEMQLLTPGFAAEFGNTTGMVVNMVTPSGTNDLHGSGMYLFSRPSFYARPFFYSGSQLPANDLNSGIGSLGGPVIKNRWHFYFGFERLQRDDSTRVNGQVRISETDKAALIAAGLSPSIFVPSIPGKEYGTHFLFRTDAQLNGNNHLTARFNRADIRNNNAIGGGFNTMERSMDVGTIDHSAGIQLISYTQTVLNELRFQYVRSHSFGVRNESSGTGPSVSITNVANFGSPLAAGTASLNKVTQLQDNFTWMRGAHVAKFGGGSIIQNNFDRAPVNSIYTFPSIPAWLAARSGDDRYSYTRYQESFGDPETRARSPYWNFFVQDDWRVTRRLKFNYGLRYDLYLVPKANPTAPLAASRKFKIDRNNLAPRFGLVYALREGTRPLVLRAGAGIYYEAPWTGMYTKALLNDGDPAFFNVSFLGTNGGMRPPDPLAPAFPNTFSGTLPPGFVVSQQNIVTIAPDLVNMYAIHSNVQLEQALTQDLSLTVGYLHSGGRHIPVYRSINYFHPVGFLADGRPIFGPERLDPRFNVIQVVESVGVSQYDAMTLQLTQRFSRGIQFAANYTLSRAVDDASEQEVTYMDGARDLRALADPTNRSFDKGYSYGDQRHTFVMSLVARPEINIRNKPLRVLLDHNQLGVIATANSGERFSVRTANNLDLNGDGLFFPDRPVGFKRNAGKTPAQFNLDLRYSRFFYFTDRYKLELLAEIQNLFNVNSIIAYNDVTVNTDPITGEIIGPIPDFKARNQSLSLESRQLQIGVKFIF